MNSFEKGPWLPLPKLAFTLTALGRPIDIHNVATKYVYYRGHSLDVARLVFNVLQLPVVQS